MLYIKPQSRRRKPRPGGQVRINPSDPLANGLLFAVPYNYGAGLAIDATQRTVPAIVGAVPWVTTARGLAVDVPGTNNNYLTWGNPTHLQFSETSSFTIFSVFTLDAGAGVYRSILGKDDPGAADRRLWDFLVGPTEKLEFFVGRIGGGATLGSVVGATSVAAAPLSIRSGAVVRDVTTDLLKLFLDGIEDASATDLSDQTWVTIPGRVNTAKDNGTLPWNGKILLHLVYARALSGSEIAELHRDPFRIFIADRMPYWDLNLLEILAKESDLPISIDGQTMFHEFNLPVEHSGLDPFALPVTWRVIHRLTNDFPLLVTWDVIANLIQNATLQVTWQLRGVPLALSIRWTILPGASGGPFPSDTPAPIVSSFTDADIHQPVATASKTP